MVYQRCILNLSNAEVARNLSVDPSTVCRTVKTLVLYVAFKDTVSLPLRIKLRTVCSIQGYRESPFKKLITVCSIQGYRESPFKKLRTVCSIQGYRESPFKKLRTQDEFAIPDVILDKPSTHLKEVQQHLLQTTGTDVCIATLCNFFAKCWIYSKKGNIKGPTKK